MPRSLAILFLAPFLGAPVLAAQEAPLLTVWPRVERVRQLVLQGDLHMIRKRYWQAVEAYQEALQLQPRDPVVLNKTGIAFHQLLRFKDAQKHYERATKVDENYAQAWNNLGTVHYGQKNHKKAIRYYERALELRPANASIRANLGAALFARKKIDDAIQQFRLALLLEPDIFQQRGRFGVLMQDHTVKDRPRFHFVVAKTFALLANVEMCLAYLRRALEEGLPLEEVTADPAFALVSEDQRFQALMTAPPQPLQP